jgi:hypothetical protein
MRGDSISSASGLRHILVVDTEGLASADGAHGVMHLVQLTTRATAHSCRLVESGPLLADAWDLSSAHNHLAQGAEHSDAPVCDLSVINSTWTHCTGGVRGAEYI